MSIRPTRYSTRSATPRRQPRGLQGRCYFGLVLLSTLALPAHAQENWVQRTTTVPQAEGRAVWDSAREKVVLFGGRANGPFLQDTLEWDGTSWQRKHTLLSPPARRDFAMAFDEARRETVLFGGFEANGAAIPVPTLDDTWTFDGANWRLRTSPQAPGARSGVAMAYDPLRERVVLFGGKRPGFMGAQPDDVWEWDGGSWSQAPTGALRPAGRSGHRLAWDPNTQQVLLFGGRGAGVTDNFSDTWTWNGTTWTQQLSPTTPPPPGLTGLSMATDLQSSTVAAVVYGVTPLPVTPSTWRWNGTTWSLETPTGPSAPPRADAPLSFDGNLGEVLAPLDFGPQFTEAATKSLSGGQWRPIQEHLAGQQFSSMVRDTLRGRTVLRLESVSSTAPDRPTTWEWDGDVWEPIARTPGEPPADVVGSTTVFDSVAGVTLQLGGRSFGAGFPGGQSYSSDLYAWDGSSWSIRPPSTATQPPARVGGTMAFDATRGVVVIQGGLLADGTRMPNTWEWDSATSVWTEKITASSPQFGFADVAVFDSVRNRVVACGLIEFPGPLRSEYWEYDGQDWTQVPPVIAPPFAQAMAFDPNRGATVGYNASASSSTWTWDGANVNFIATGGGFQPEMVYDETRGNVMLFAGDATTWFLGQGLVPAASTSYGIGCAGSLGTPSLSGRGVPFEGNADFQLELTSSAGPSALLIGTATASLPVGPCTILVNPDLAVVPFPASSAQGFVEFPLAIPRDTTLHGISLFCQAAIADPGAMGAGFFSLTGGLELTIGE